MSPTAPLYRELMDDNAAFVKRQLIVTDLPVNGTGRRGSVTWERCGVERPHAVDSYINTRISSPTRRATLAHCPAVVGTLDDALKAIAADDNASYTDLETDLVGPDLLLGAEVLATIQPRTKVTPHEYIGLKHVSYQSLLDGHGAEDFVLMETVGKGIDLDGRAFAYKVLRSIELPQFAAICPATEEDTMEFYRGTMHAFALILTETSEPGVLELSVRLDIDVTRHAKPFSGGLSALHDALSLALRYRRTIEMSFFENVKSGTAQLIKSSAVFAASTLSSLVKARTKRCQMCERRVGRFIHKRYTCGVCSIALCHACIKSTDFNSWSLCFPCYDRNETLYSRSIISKMVSSSLSKLGFIARRSAGICCGGAGGRRHSLEMPQHERWSYRCQDKRHSVPELFTQPDMPQPLQKPEPPQEPQAEPLLLPRSVTDPTPLLPRRRAPPPPVPTRRFTNVTSRANRSLADSFNGRREAPPTPKMWDKKLATSAP
ncbi:TPA: hypothetical protein N0F65_003195 [Lagenidium giganteum]|uniref:FYVE-type domain-containing protein n=1 Tax=Lagenidium giganteum TaxID=4803 RepID=A0AAV2Z8D4_9STRA|nr:TPA: hypothetical protein N0F65_003195 [Lagenidium giganteum]